jgi:hypothetical protein
MEEEKCSIFVERLYSKEAYPMSGVFQNIDLTPSPPGECVPPAFGAGGGHTRCVEGGGGNILEDARHCSVLYIRQYFVSIFIRGGTRQTLAYGTRNKSLDFRTQISFSWV